jgi:hypothetical protein
MAGEFLFNDLCNAFGTAPNPIAYVFSETVKG